MNSKVRFVGGPECGREFVPDVLHDVLLVEVYPPATWMKSGVEDCTATASPEIPADAKPTRVHVYKKAAVDNQGVYLYVHTEERKGGDDADQEVRDQ